jgi:hypothetical protein
MARIDRENVFELIVNEDDPIIAKYQYISYFLGEYEGEFVNESLNKLRESMMYYSLAFDVPIKIDENL